MFDLFAGVKCMRVLLSAAVHLSAMMRMLAVHRAAGCEQHCALSQSNLKRSAAIMMWRAAHLDALRHIQHADGAQTKAIIKNRPDAGNA